MVFAFLAFVAVAIAIFYVVNGSVSKNKIFLVEVLEAVDGRRLKVNLDNKQVVVLLGGIGYPSGDEKAAFDAINTLQSMVVNRRFNMEIMKQIEGLMYVDLKSADGDSLNETLLRKGLARFESHGVGFVSSMMAAETEAKQQAIGVWDKNRDLFKHMTGNPAEDEAYFADHGEMDSFDDEDRTFPSASSGL